MIGVDFSHAKLVLCDLKGTPEETTGILFANFEGAFLMGADFSNSVLQYARFKNANLRHAIGLSERQLASLASLRGATMPDGKRYDGRFNLHNDLQAFRKSPLRLFGTRGIARWYGVIHEVYTSGQTWAQENLSTITNNPEDAEGE